jgi:hypothetical protein
VCPEAGRTELACLLSLARRCEWYGLEGASFLLGILLTAITIQQEVMIAL